MKRNHLLLILGLALAAAAYYGYRQYNAEPLSAAGRTADFNVQAPALFTEFQQDEMAAGTRYNDKLVAVEGTVRSMSTAEEGLVNVVLETGDPLGGVVCELAPGTVPGLVAGDHTRIQGYCAGFNLDVLLQRCTVIELKPQH